MKTGIKQLSHASFATRDLEATLRFYEDVLDFQRVHEFRNDRNELYGAYLSAGRATFLEFFNAPDEGAPGDLFRHICFVVDDIEALSAGLRERGYDGTIYRGRTDRTLQMWITDPNGIRVEFHQYDGESCLLKFQQ